MVALTDVTEVCGDEPATVCEWIANNVESTGWARALDWAIGIPLTVAATILVGWFVSRFVRKAIVRFGERAASRDLGILNGNGRSQKALARVAALEGRSLQRANTLTSVLGSLATAIIWCVVLLLVLGQVGISLAPLLAGAGVAGLVLGLGAQSVVADFLAGMFMLIEDQFGVGDVIDTGEVTGTVEEVSLRVTTLRDVNGTVWHIPNSEIHRVANMSQLWSRAVLDIEVAYETDIRRAEGVIQRVADELWQDPEFQAGDIIDAPEVWGVQNLGADGVAIRLVVKTDPAEQWAVARELRLRIKEALDEAGIEIPFPQRTVWVRHVEDSNEPQPTVEVAELRPQTRSFEAVENPPG